ncbi:hypothetical protein [Streptomyces lavendulae]|uniref:hypothetical protein n=1 Tax=Streptomyces lavendulae TaxID=1914 RepID=UPI003820F43A
MTSPEAKGPEAPPSRTPESPHQPEKPVGASRPQPVAGPDTEVEVRRPRMIVRNRRTAAFTYRADAWAAAKAARRTADALRGWGYPALDEDDLRAAVHQLVTAAVANGGKRVSVHLGDQDQKVLVAVLSHTSGPSDETVLSDMMALGTIDSVGADIGEDGHRLWVVLDAAPRCGRARHTAA